MMNSDSAWDDAFHDLWLHTVRHRGLLTSLAELPGPARDSAMPAWPRTRGADVLAIASVIDPVLRAQARQPGSYGIDHQWRSCACDIADHALVKPEREYAQNRAFWATLAEVVAYLASIDAAIPADLWRALFAEIAGPREHRNARVLRDDYLQVMAASYDGLWQVQKDALARLRGADVGEPTGQMRGPSMAIPRTTLSDVLHLADFWTDTMHLVERKAQNMPPEAFATLGYNAVRRHWYAALADLDHEVEAGEPEEVHTKNHEFWRAAAHLATVLAVIDEAPSKLDQALSGVMTHSRNADPATRRASSAIATSSMTTISSSPPTTTIRCGRRRKLRWRSCAARTRSIRSTT
jgi:hypothetical protein